MDSAYYNEPTPLQLASYGEYVVQLVNDRDIKGLKSAFSLGLSRNPCNAMGESLLQLICRQGDGSKLLSVMLKAGSDVQVSDSLGSTLLHDACQAPQLAFALIEMLLKRDINLLSMTDAQGSLPLSYVRAEHWSQWLRFLESKKEALWPRTVNDGSKPPLVQMKPNSKPITLPKNPLSLDLAKMVATGQITPNAARDRDEDEVFCDDQNDDTPPCGKVDSSASEFSYNIINDDDEDDSWNEDEMNDILQNLSGSGAQQPLAW